jgi:hypothetical protein
VFGREFNPNLLMSTQFSKEKKNTKKDHSILPLLKLPPLPPYMRHVGEASLPHREKKYHEIGKASITAVLALVLNEFSTLLIIISKVYTSCYISIWKKICERITQPLTKFELSCNKSCIYFAVIPFHKL